MQHTSDIPPIGLIRDSRGFMKIATAVKLFFFLSTFYFVPGAQAVEQAVEAEQARNEFHPGGRSDEEKLSNTLQAIKEHVAERKAHVGERVSKESGLWQDFLNLFGASGLLAEDMDRLQSMSEVAEQLHRKNLGGFAEIEQDLQAKGLPEVILQRHADTVSKYQEQYRQFREKLGRALQAESLQDQDSALGQLSEFLDEQQFKRRQQPFDPDKLPFGTPDPRKTREPATDPQQLNELLGLSRQPGALETIIDGMIAPAYAQTGNQPAPADLEPTIDVQITPEIQQLANSLNHSPTEIYAWVHNNIRFIPSYGSIQGSHVTLLNRQGNATDTASLLIALLRASNIPARYVVGTVEIPVEQVMNWVGGVNVPEAAQQLLGQGGIPNIAIAQGGKISHIRLEHTWVEAYVDFEPSRGMNNIVGDSWVSMDASFKQYNFMDGLEIADKIPFGVAEFVEDIESNAAGINETEGWVQGVPQERVQAAFEAYKEEVASYIENELPDATVGEILGSKTIRVKAPHPLASGLPYELLGVKSTFSSIPAGLQHKFKFELARDALGYGLDETPIVSFQLPTVQLAGKKIALSFRPATSADESLVRSFLPNAGQDGTIDASQISSIPGYLVRLVAELTVDGVTIAQSGSLQMGEQLSSTTGLWSPSSGWEVSRNNPVAGEYVAIGLNLQGVLHVQYERLIDEIQSAKSLLEAQDVSELDKHKAIGNLLQGGIIAYFAYNDAQDILDSRKANIVEYRHPSYGFFYNSLETSFFFGLPRNVSSPGVIIDVDRSATISMDKDNDRQNWVVYNRGMGMRYSAMEHVIPERLFLPANDPREAVSAVKALVAANAEGQRIYTITRANAGSVLPVLNLASEVRTEIANAVNSGKEVTVSERNVNVSGWSGVGYIIIDPETGAGAYKISGGSNGGILLLFLGALLLVLGLFFFAGGGLLGAFLLSLGGHAFLIGLLEYFSNPDAAFDFDAALLFIGGLGAILGILAPLGIIALPVLGAVILSVISLIAFIRGLYLLLTFVGDIRSREYSYA